MLDLEPAFTAHCSACGTLAVVAAEAGYDDEDRVLAAHVELRLKGWTRDASGAQFCPACTASR